ncbi:MAG: right-handed parallel beta-helix repeat-containing protein [Flavobacterium sp.]|nr:right-handed parallel beta-helix repeat-containing protein [Flavobacterium sp.]
MKFKFKYSFQLLKNRFQTSLLQAALVVGLAFCTVFDASAQLIIRTDFNREKVWLKDYRAAEKWAEVAASSGSSAVSANISWGKFGTIDVASTYTPSECLVLSVENPTVAKNWSAAINSGLLVSKNTESNLGKLTFSFDNSVSPMRPVVVRIESFDTNKKRTGGLEKTVYPATANHFLRSAFELTDMKAFGAGKFNPLDPFVNFSFSIADAEGTNSTDNKYELRIDNVMYATPAFYVSPSGNDNNNGRSEKTAFANPQKAIDVAKSGDIVLLMNGQYSGAKNAAAVVSFVRPGRPSSWITLKNYPGHKATILCDAKNGINILHKNDSTAQESPLLSYLEVRGLHIRGNADKVPELYPAEVGIGTPNTETRGIHLTGSNGPTRMYHHIRVADCLIEYCGTDGIWASEVDYLTVENNTIRNNCWTSVEAVSAGFSCMMYADFDKIDNATKILVRNNHVYGNQRKTKRKIKDWAPEIFNGNGLLFDANSEDYIYPDFYLGRTLIQNNLIYGNGGGGIQNWGCHRLDIVNNTIYHNGISPELRWGNIGLDYCKDVRIVNNIVVALPDRPLDYWMPEREDHETSKIVRINNLYFGGMKPNIKGISDVVADPMFVNPSLNPSVADFRLKPESPAINSGVQNFTASPSVDLDAKTRPTKALNRGSY